MCAFVSVLWIFYAVSKFMLINIHSNQLLHDYSYVSCNLLISFMPPGEVK
jgi:hypothetical protein